MSRPTERRPTLTLSIVHWNTREHLARCLASLCEACGGARAEILALDTESIDGSAAMVQQASVSLAVAVLE